MDQSWDCAVITGIVQRNWKFDELNQVPFARLLFKINTLRKKKKEAAIIKYRFSFYRAVTKHFMTYTDSISISSDSRNISGTR